MMGIRWSFDTSCPDWGWSSSKLSLESFPSKRNQPEWSESSQMGQVYYMKQADLCGGSELH